MLHVLTLAFPTRRSSDLIHLETFPFILLGFNDGCKLGGEFLHVQVHAGVAIGVVDVHGVAAPAHLYAHARYVAFGYSEDRQPHPLLGSVIISGMEVRRTPFAECARSLWRDGQWTDRKSTRLN